MDNSIKPTKLGGYMNYYMYILMRLANLSKAKIEIPIMLAGGFAVKAQRDTLKHWKKRSINQFKSILK